MSGGKHTHTSLPDISEGITSKRGCLTGRLQQDVRPWPAQEDSVTNQQLGHQVETAAE